MIAQATKKSRKDSRPTNPLGLITSPEVFAPVCQRHKFELVILPTAMLKGWPRSIEWENIEARIVRMERNLRELIEEPGTREKCFFWGETLEAIRQNGASAMSRIEGQFRNFENTRPG